MKKVFPVIIAIILIVFSFYYTNLAVNIVRNNDPIMKKIVMVSNELKKEPVNAILIKNSIIPGISGEEIDLNESYISMKKYGDYNKNLLVFKSVEPTVSIKKIYDRYITKGNERNNNVSIIFKLENSNNLSEILRILDTKKIKSNFFLNEDLIDNFELTSKINNYGHSIDFVGNYSDNNIRTINRNINRTLNINLKYCYFEKENIDMLKVCGNNKLYSIIPTILDDESKSLNIRDIDNGYIIRLNNSNKITSELVSIINYIKQKGYNIVLLDELIKE